MKYQPKVNDVIEIKEGMCVTFDQFENRYFEAGRLDGQGSHAILVGHTYFGRGDEWPTRIRIRNFIYEIFKREGRPVDTDILMRFLAHQVKDSIPAPPFKIPAGKYVVKRVEPEGLGLHVHCATFSPSVENPAWQFHFSRGLPGNADNIDFDFVPVTRS